MTIEAESSVDTGSGVTIKGATTKKVLTVFSFLLFLVAISLFATERYAYGAAASVPLPFFVGVILALHKYAKKQKDAVQEVRGREAAAEDVPAAATPPAAGMRLG